MAKPSLCDYLYGEILRSYETGGNVNNKYKFIGRFRRIYQILRTEKERDIETGYDYFLPGRTYDSKLVRWLQVDPLASQRHGLSPYNYCQNNPLIFKDPTGILDIRIEFDEKGKVKNVVDDGKSEITGAIVNDNDEIIQSFIFNSTLDAKAILTGNANPDGLKIKGINNSFEGSIQALIELGTSLSEFSNSNLEYAATASQKGGPMDFVQYIATENYDKLVIINNVAYNTYDAGNFVWGAAMAELNIPYLITRIGAEVNAIFNSRRDNNFVNGFTLHDDPGDIMAYTRGYYWKRK